MEVAEVCLIFCAETTFSYSYMPWPLPITSILSKTYYLIQRICICAVILAKCSGAKYLVSFSTRSLKTREKCLFDIIVIFFILKLKSKHFPKKCTNWAKLIYFSLVLREGKEKKPQIFRTPDFCLSWVTTKKCWIQGLRGFPAKKSSCTRYHSYIT